jgi:PAS domain S-box-containing protein
VTPRRRLAEHKTAEEELQYRAAFENLLTTLSTEFISLKREEIDGGIEKALRRIAEFTQDDRSWVILYSDDWTTMENTHEWCASGISTSKPPFRAPVSAFPWCNERLRRGEVVHIPCVADLPRAASIDKALLESVGNQSNILVPMACRGKTIGSLGFDSVRRQRSWSNLTTVLLRAVGEMFVNALERKWVEEQLLESQQALSTLIGNLPGMAFRLRNDDDGSFEFLSGGCQELTGYVPEELVQNARLSHIQMVYPADRESVRRAVSTALKNRTSYCSTHRIVTAFGDIKWLWEQGRAVTYLRREVPVVEGFATDATDRVLDYQRLEERVEQRTKEIERRRAVAEGLRDLVEALNDSRPLDEVLDHVVDEASRLLATSGVAIYRLQRETPALIIEAARGLRANRARGTAFPISGRSATKLAAQRRPLLVGAADQDCGDVWLARELGSVHRKSMTGRCRAFLFVPLVVSGEVYGALVHYYATSTEFSSERVELATMFGRQAELAIGNAWLRAQAEENAAAQERSRIAADLHDSVTQSLFSASLTAEALPDLLVEDPAEAQRSLQYLQTLTRGLVSDMRGLLLELRPAHLSPDALDHLLGDLVQTSSACGGLPIELTIEGKTNLPRDVQIALYRIAQEALNNVIRHAHAASASVTLRSAGDGVRLRVSDGGAGFDQKGITPEHLGLTIMRERSKAIGADLTIESGREHGTRVCARWPHRGNGSRHE